MTIEDYLQHQSKLYPISGTPIKRDGQIIGWSNVSAYQVPYSIIPSEGKQNYIKSQEGRKYLKSLTNELTEIYDGNQENSPFPFCCSAHSKLVNFDFFNTLAQNGTNKIAIDAEKPVIIVKGEGTDVANIQILQNRAKRKTTTQKIIPALVEVATKKGDHERANLYWNTYHCLNRMVLSGENRTYGNYCKNRFCTLCAGIRKAEIINKYMPILKSWDEPYFVTLTAKAVPAISLRKRMSDMLRGIKKIIQKIKKRAQRNTSFKLIGIRSLECNFNPQQRTYNPHFHLIVPDKKTADCFIKEWLTLLTTKFAASCAQKATKIYDREKALVEIVKYCTKIFTDPTMQKSKKKTTHFVYISAIDNIIAAMKGLRIFESFGFRLPKKEKISKITMLSVYHELTYDPILSNWVSSKNIAISNFDDNNQLINILTDSINKDVE